MTGISENSAIVDKHSLSKGVATHARQILVMFLIQPQGVCPGCEIMPYAMGAVKKEIVFRKRNEN